MQTKAMKQATTRLGAALDFTAKNFLVPIAFFVTFRIYGSKPAIALAIVGTLVQLGVHAITRTKPSPFFLVATGFTVVLGGIDLFVDSPRFYRLEPGLQNLLMGTVFLVTVYLRKPIVVWFAAALPESVRPDLGPNDVDYLRKVTFAWSLYFFAKGVLFIWIALKVDLGRLVILRSIIGGSSMALMFGGELLVRRRYKARQREARELERVLGTIDPRGNDSGGAGVD
jgi:intracellular septation protein A